MVNFDTNQTTCYVRDERCVLVLEIRRAITFLFVLCIYYDIALIILESEFLGKILVKTINNLA